MTRPFAFAAAIVAVAFVVGCEAGPGYDKTPESPQTEAPVPAVAPVTSAQPLVAAGPAAPLTAERDENLQWAASVVDLFPIEDQGAKLFGTAGGDPAMNGLYTHVAFFAGPADGWAEEGSGRGAAERVSGTSRTARRPAAPPPRCG